MDDLNIQQLKAILRAARQSSPACVAYSKMRKSQLQDAVRALPQPLQVVPANLQSVRAPRERQEVKQQRQSTQNIINTDYKKTSDPDEYVYTLNNFLNSLKSLTDLRNRNLSRDQIKEIYKADEREFSKLKKSYNGQITPAIKSKIDAIKFLQENKARYIG